MKNLIFISFLFFNFLTISFAQNDLTKEHQQYINRVVELVKNDNVQQLADLVIYPIKRPYPIPNITNKREFILYYPTLFDEAFKAELLNPELIKDRTSYSEDYQRLSMLWNKLLMNKEGKITAIHNDSPVQKKLQANLEKEAKTLVHKSINTWESIGLLCKTERFLIRIDNLGDEKYRYAAWDKSKTMSDKPDLILFDGEYEYGSSGNYTFIFKSAKWTYELNYIVVGAEDSDYGLYLRVYQGERGNEKKLLKQECERIYTY